MEKSESIINLWLLVGGRRAVEGILHVSTLCPCERSFANMHEGGSSLSQQLGYENGGCWHLLLRDQGAMSLTRKKVPAQMLSVPRWNILCPVTILASLSPYPLSAWGSLTHVFRRRTGPYPGSHLPSYFLVCLPAKKGLLAAPPKW